MLKKHTFWIKSAIVFQLLTATVHALTFLNQSVPKNETEKQLIDLMNNYKQDLGAGFTPSMTDLVSALSACFSLICLFGGILNWYLLRKQIDISVLKGVIVINTIIFGIVFFIMAFLTFLPPIVLTGLIFLSLLLAWVTFPKQEAYP